MSFIRICLLATCVLLAACALNGGDRVPDEIYLLDWTGDLAVTPHPETTRCPALLVISPLSASGFGTSRIAYMEQDYQLNYFVTHRWADAPANMLEPLMIRALESSGLFRAVLESPAPIETELRLESELLHLRQVFETRPADGGEAAQPVASRVELALRMELFDLTDRERIASKIFTVTDPSASPDPYGGVLAANRAVARLLATMVDFLEARYRAGTWAC